MSEEKLPEMIPVLNGDGKESSNIHSRGYDSQNEFLYVQFKNKAGEPTALYRHSGVSAQVYTSFAQSFSKRKFYHAQIRGQYPVSKL